MAQHMRWMKKLASKDLEKIRQLSEKKQGFQLVDVREDTLAVDTRRITYKRCYIETNDSGPLKNVGWVINENVSVCLICNKDFGVLKRWRHHCRACGDLVCTACSNYAKKIKGYDKLGKFKVCVNCHNMEEPRSSFVYNWQTMQTDVVKSESIELHPNHIHGKSILHQSEDSKIPTQSMEISNPEEPAAFDPKSFP
jgi:hypothetical protein